MNDSKALAKYKSILVHDTTDTHTSFNAFQWAKSLPFFFPGALHTFPVNLGDVWWDLLGPITTHITFDIVTNFKYALNIVPRYRFWHLSKFNLVVVVGVDGTALVAAAATDADTEWATDGNELFVKLPKHISPSPYLYTEFVFKFISLSTCMRDTIDRTPNGELCQATTGRPFCGMEWNGSMSIHYSGVAASSLLLAARVSAIDFKWLACVCWKCTRIKSLLPKLTNCYPFYGISSWAPSASQPPLPAIVDLTSSPLPSFKW